MMTSTAVKRSRVLIIDDHPTFCEGLAALFQCSDDFEVVGKAWTSSAALSAARALQPGIIVLDVTLGNDGSATAGLDLVHQLRRICPEVKIAILTGSTVHEHLMIAMRLGVEAYLQKDLAPDALMTAIRQVRDGERVIGNPHHLTLALTQLQEIIQERVRADCGLTAAELEMLRLAAGGLNNKQIGIQQFWSEITVKRKMQSVYRKLGVKTRAQAVAEAIRRGFV